MQKWPRVLATQPWLGRFQSSPTLVLVCQTFLDFPRPLRIRMKLSNCLVESLRSSQNWRPPAKPVRGWDRIMAEQVLQADEGCDLAVLRAGG